jgi:hypothetical protein
MQVFACVRSPTLGPCRFLVNGTARVFGTRSQVVWPFLPGVAGQSQFVLEVCGRRTKIARIWPRQMFLQALIRSDRRSTIDNASARHIA